jgi:hypothetical protein
LLEEEDGARRGGGSYIWLFGYLVWRMTMTMMTMTKLFLVVVIACNS